MSSLALALRAAGYVEVRTFTEPPALEREGSGNGIELHLPEAWRPTSSTLGADSLRIGWVTPDGEFYVATHGEVFPIKP